MPSPPSKPLPTEPYGNAPEKQVNFDKLIAELKCKKELAEYKKKLEQESAANSERMWSAIEQYGLNKNYNVDPVYANLPDTSTYIEACEEFIDEITNETFFYDLINKVEHKNRLLKRFQMSIKSFDKRFSEQKNWNILIELGEIRRIANHGPQCLDLAANNDECSCYEECHDGFIALIKDDIELSRLDDASFKQHADLHSYFYDWVAIKYPDLLV